MNVAPMLEGQRGAVMAQKFGIQRLKKRECLETRNEVARPGWRGRRGKVIGASWRKRQQQARTDAKRATRNQCRRSACARVVGPDHGANRWANGCAVPIPAPLPRPHSPA